MKQQLYRILLVDDEEEVRHAIIQKIPWEELGFQVVGDAENGMDALEKIEQLEPDVVLSDIRMPYMDGLSLAKVLRQSRPSLKMVIFSGYDDFEYAKQAIRLNVVEYILKPVNAEELSSILRRIRDTLEAEVAKLRDETTLKENFKRNLPLLRENFLNNLIRGRVVEAQMQEKLEEYQLELGKGAQWLVVYLTPEQGWLVAEKKEMAILSIKQLFERHFSSFACAFFHYHRDLCAVIALQEGQTKDDVIAILTDSCRESRRILDLVLTVGVGQPVRSLMDLEESYLQAREAAGYQEIAGAGDVIYIEDVDRSNSTFVMLDSKTESDLVSVLKFGMPEKTKQCVEGILEKMRATPMHEVQYQAYVISLFHVILHIVSRYELNARTIFGGKENYFEILNEIQDRSALAPWLMKTCLSISEELSDERQDSTANMIRLAKQFIQENYPNSALSLETICQYLHISPTYFSTVFKREVGESYTGYLTRVRMEQAAVLLSTTEEKTYVIAKEVGYEEPNYFGYVFKKTYGVSPNKYRAGERK